MTATAPHGARLSPAWRRPGRSTVVVGAVAAALALWLGLTAPGASPVGPPAPTQSVELSSWRSPV